MMTVVDLARMLAMCHRDQWAVADLDWSQRPRSMSADDEMAIVQYFTDMAGIELLAAALFEEQRRRTDDPMLREIFTTFVVDEKRHSEAAGRLARFYDVRRLREYRRSTALTRFFPHFVRAISLLDDDVANEYILGGELILDVALLRSIDDYVRDPMSAQAMRLINRDESRHIAIDYYMAAYYQSHAYARKAAGRRTPFRRRAVAWWTLGNVLFFAKPFFRDVFFEPMERLDPEGERLKEAFRRIELVMAKQSRGGPPFARFMASMKALYNTPVAGRIFGGLASRIAGVDERFMRRLATDAEWTRAEGMSFDELAQEALQAKNSGSSRDPSTFS